MNAPNIDPSKVTVVLGPPGVGKTHRLLTEVEEALARGVKPNRIGYVSFTKKATEEARARASQRFSIDPEELVHFRTIHSFAFRHLGMRRDHVLGWSHLNELGKMLGLEFKGKGSSDDDGDFYGMGAPDRLLFLEGLARNKLAPLQRVWNDANEDEIDYMELERFSRALAQYKKSRALSDFTDMVERFNASDPRTMPQLDLLVVDEVQDLSLLQWRSMELLAQSAKQIIVGGDDCQAIYAWSGADVDSFINLSGKSVLLDQSYRVPASVHKVADSISDKVTHKRERKWRPRNEVGEVNWVGNFDDVDMGKGNWLILARNSYLLAEIEDYCMSQGYSFHSTGRDPLKSKSLSAIKVWENLRKGRDESAENVLATLLLIPARWCPMALLKQLRADEAGRMYGMPELRSLGLGTIAIWYEALGKISPSERDYFLAARRQGEALLKEPRIRLSTIHGSKGGEGQNILLLTDMSFRSYENANNKSQAAFEDECRVWYVAVTRARETLNIVQAKTDLYFGV